MSLSNVRQNGAPVVNLIKFKHRKFILLSSLLVGLGICLLILAAVFSGRFPYYGDARTFCLVLSALLTAYFTVGFIVNLIRITSAPERPIFYLFFGVIFLVSIAEYYYLIRQQDDSIANTISTIENNVGSYELLSDIPDNEAREILSDRRIQKYACGVSYFFCSFYLCLKQPHKNIVFMIDIAPAPGMRRTIRVSESLQNNP